MVAVRVSGSFMEEEISAPVSTRFFFWVAAVVLLLHRGVIARLSSLLSPLLSSGSAQVFR